MFYCIPPYLFSIVFFVHEHVHYRSALELESSSDIVIETFLS